MLNTNRIVKLAACAVLVIGTAGSAAQERSTSTEGNRCDLDKIRKVSTLIGTEVVDPANKNAATIRDLVLAPGGEVRYAVLGYGGVAGVGETFTAAPFDVLNVRQEDGKWAVNLGMASDDLKKAPTIKSESYREFADPQWTARLDQFFRPSSESAAQSDRDNNRKEGELRAVDMVLLGTKIRAAKLKNSQNENLGKVEDLLLDRNDRVVFVIIGRGGVLGIGEHFIAIPWSKFEFSGKHENVADTVMLSSTKAELERAPVVKGDNYETLLGKGFAHEVHQYFGVSEDKVEKSETERR